MRVKSAFSASELCHAKHKNVSIKTLQTIDIQENPCNLNRMQGFSLGAGGGARTRTVVTPRDFKTSTESRREKTYEEVNAKNPCDCKALNGKWRKLEATRKRAFFLEKSDSERKRRERAKNKQAFLPMTNSDDKRKRHEEESCVLSKAVSGIS